MTGVTWEWYQGLRHQQQWKQIVHDLYCALVLGIVATVVSLVNSFVGAMRKLLNEVNSIPLRKMYDIVVSLSSKVGMKVQNLWDISIFQERRWLHFQKIKTKWFLSFYCQSIRENTIQQAAILIKENI